MDHRDKYVRELLDKQHHTCGKFPLAEPRLGSRLIDLTCDASV